LRGDREMKEMLVKLFSLGVWALCATVSVVIAGGTVATLGVARNVDSKVERVRELVVRSNQLNDGMREPSNPPWSSTRRPVWWGAI
jgi:hypothetical protein